MRVRFTALLFAAPLWLAACQPAGPDPDPVTPPEDVAASTLPALPGAQPPVVAAVSTAPAELSEAERQEMEAACSLVSAEGMCNVGFGMSEAEARAAFPSKLYGGPDENASCYYLRPSATSYGRAFMVIDGSVQRVDVRDGSAETLLGAGVGTPLSEIEAMYENTQRTPNKYAPANDDLKVDLGNGVYAVFESDKGIVRAFRVGLEPAVDYVEGCA